MTGSGAAMEAHLRKAHRAGELAGLHGVLVLHQGQIFAETYFAGTDQRWGMPVGHRAFSPDSLHDLRSITKSITGLLYGIALDEGLVPALDAPLLAHFPEMSDLTCDPRRMELRVVDALTMSLGLAWNETHPYTDVRNGEMAMELASDRCRYVLEQDLIHTPGAVWNYSGGATALIGRLIERGSGQTLNDYARERLFTPLGITDYEWVRCADGVHAAASGLRMTARDLAKIGQLILDDGWSAGTSVIPSDWINESFTPRQSAHGLRYGYFWWLAPDGDTPNWAAGFGHGGQRLSINRPEKLVFITFAGNYNTEDAWRLPYKISLEFLSPALTGHKKQPL